MIAVIDCGMGNLQSVIRGLQKAGGTAVVSSRCDDVAAADRIVLPGVGSFGHGMENLRNAKLMSVLTKKVREDNTPLLGICVGHQMLTTFSEEGAVAGLGWIDGTTTRLPSQSQCGSVKIPHMGWNTLQNRKDCPLLRGIPDDACFYFAHSYSVACAEDQTVVATTEYGCSFASIVQKDNVFGVQFHPEKSHANGITVLRNFLDYN
ncbi:MAG: imidazole glycerol phosphate synthase subunit HisH [Fuerstiella sp.]|nr:imidazole glycerol phosphate synthase subunit HisH [Fuerstiella sp.]